MWESFWNLSRWTRLPVFVEAEGCLFGPNAQTWELFLVQGTNTWSSHFLYFTPLPSVPRKTENQTRESATRHAKPICSAYCSSHVARTRLNGVQEKRKQHWRLLWETRNCALVLDAGLLADHRHRTWEMEVVNWRMSHVFRESQHGVYLSLGRWMCNESTSVLLYIHWQIHNPADPHKRSTHFFIVFQETVIHKQTHTSTKWHSSF